jgi:hypothetical protein
MGRRDDGAELLRRQLMLVQRLPSSLFDSVVSHKGLFGRTSAITGPQLILVYSCMS